MLRFTLAAAAALALTALAHAQDHRHPGATYDGATAQFYETWMRPAAALKAVVRRTSPNDRV
jgi:hypothetical protein